MQKYVNLPSKIIITHYCRRVVDILCLEFWRSLAIGSNDMQVCESKKKTGNFYLFFICFDAKMSFMFLLKYCHVLGCGTFVPSIMISNWLPPSYKYSIKKFYTIVTPCWSVLDFWKINLEKSSPKNLSLIFSLFRTWFLLPV